MPADKRAIDKELIRDLAALLAETDLSEIEIEQEGLRVRVARMGHAVAAPAAVVAAAPAAAVAPSAASPGGEALSPGTVTSPMVGTAYRSPDPKAQPFIEVVAKRTHHDGIVRNAQRTP